MWLMVTMAMAGENLAGCLQAQVVLKEPETGEIRDYVSLAARFKNGCEKETLAFEGVFVFRAKVGEGVAVRGARAATMHLEVGEFQRIGWRFPMWGRESDLWLLVAPLETMTVAWIPTAIVFVDGSLVTVKPEQAPEVPADSELFVDGNGA